ncbi:MAG TPA: YdcH family protein [Candidatus Acidoferrales bacterium]|jgi:uncharacterized protein YdcH (DUF465 family)|nr:YdcH family protein [Candidatus Acidoferrales bacterium]
MPITPGDIREQLLASNPEFQRLAQEHSRYEAQLDQLTKSSFHNVEELIQEAELKKLRLRVKDEMEQLVARSHRARSASAG